MFVPVHIKVTFWWGGLFNDNASVRHYKMTCNGVSDKWRTGADLDRRGRGVIEVLSPEFACMAKMMITSQIFDRDDRCPFPDSSKAL